MEFMYIDSLCERGLEVSLANFAAMHVSLKNADLNDNGKIDEDEVKWYIPSKAELELISATDGGAYSLVNASYWSSTAINKKNQTNAYARNVYTQKTCVSKPRDGMCRVRAVRKPD